MTKRGEEVKVKKVAFTVQIGGKKETSTERSIGLFQVGENYQVSRWVQLK